jgi:hypothetical protein
MSWVLHRIGPFNFRISQYLSNPLIGFRVLKKGVNFALCRVQDWSKFRVFFNYLDDNIVHIVKL